LRCCIQFCSSAIVRCLPVSRNFDCPRGAIRWIARIRPTPCLAPVGQGDERRESG
jgi:hypothetical protein